MKYLKLILFLLAIIAIAVVLILNKYSVYGSILMFFVLFIYFFWNWFIKDRDKKIIEQAKIINVYESRIQELEQQKLNISKITTILELGLLEIDTTFYKVFNRLYDNGKIKFQGTLRIDIKAKYGINLKELRFKHEDDKIMIYNLKPKFLSFSKRDCDWQFAQTMEYVKPFLFGESNWRIKSKNDKITLNESEILRKQTEKELENGIEELKWIEKPFLSQTINVLKIFLFPNKEIYLCDYFDDNFVDIDNFYKLMDGNF